MQLEATATEEFANRMFGDVAPGFHSDSEIPAMACPIVAAAQFVIQGSTICLVC